ncbi:hypothetical protein CYMTET_31335 [Cymbomonas tetramitiformis]|uniref:Uncharacterized protein n=1 Tax=Cymbomonas tetramitiformis TaxID=36881 RepID=A0AAE0FHR2_9CHLO|nr:hypothetical protein CYMTET_31335 [Cymbomonas tetramitiformis]
MIVACAETGSTNRSRLASKPVASLCTPERYSAQNLLKPKQTLRSSTRSCFFRLELRSHGHLTSRHSGARNPRIGLVRTNFFRQGSRVPTTQLRGRQVAYPLTAALPDDAGDIIQQKSDIVKQGGVLSGFFSVGTLAKLGSVCLVGLDIVGGVLFLASAPSWVQGKSLWRNLYDVTYETFDATFKEFMPQILLLAILLSKLFQGLLQR